MKGALVFFMLMVVAYGERPSVKTFPIWAPSPSLLSEYTTTSSGWRNSWPYTSGITLDTVRSITGTPYTNPFDIRTHPLLVKDIYDKPIMVFAKAEDKEGVKGCLVENGIVSLVDNPCTERVIGRLISDDEKRKKVLLVDPTTFNFERIYNVKDLTVLDVEMPKDIKMWTLARISSKPIPWLIVLDDEEFDRLATSLGLRDVAGVEISGKSVNLSHDPYYSYLAPISFYPPRPTFLTGAVPTTATDFAPPTVTFVSPVRPTAANLNVYVRPVLF